SSTTSLINMYSKCHQMNDAVLVFKNQLHDYNVFAYNALIYGFIANGFAENGLEFYGEMRLMSIVPDRFTFPCLMKGCCDVMDVLEVRKIHGLAFKLGLELDVFVGSALVKCYLKLLLIEDAHVVFEELPVRDVVLWNAMVNGFAQLGLKGVGDAVMIFEMMKDKDIFSWNSILSVHEQCGDYDGTLRLFESMLDAGLRPDLVTVTTVLPACSKLAALMHGREIHGYMIINGLSNNGNCKNIDDTLLMNAVMDMYAKCGSMRDALMVFDKMSNKDLASWNIMIVGYGLHGYGKKALNMFSKLCEANIKPDDVTFVGLLSACSHAGFVSQGREFMLQMESKYGVVPTIEHYTCVIDMFGRAGQLEEAYEFAVTMSVESNPVVWRALLSACHLHGNANLADVATQRLFELEPEHCGNYVLMSNVYVVAGRYKEVLDVRKTMREQNVKKTPGCSWIELKDGVHAFITCDRFHPEAKSIY
ncbi:PPR domain-containing protein/PPR_2 domain-containing protein, partial [Cephalotus follicularis]